MRVEWTAQARRDFRAAVLWLAQRNPRSAAELDAAVIEAEDRIAAMPGLGSPLLRAGARTVVLARWNKLMIYRFGGGRVQIVAFRDARRRPVRT